VTPDLPFGAKRKRKALISRHYIELFDDQPHEFNFSTGEQLAECGSLARAIIGGAPKIVED
jgi:hypothetical protein